MKKLLLGLAFFAMPVFGATVNGIYWPQEIQGRDILLKNGYHDIYILYIQGLRCADGVYDQNRVSFRAISKEDHVIEGTVCNGQVYPQRTTVTEV